jgi:hypothetical protein
MNVPVWIAELATAFWKRAAQDEPFPRSLRRSIARAMPLSVVFLPQLSIAAVLKWLQESGIVCELGSADRPLRACLVARYGHGVAFVDGADSDAEQCFSLAHELAHFLQDYWCVRQQICKRLGERALEVFDGDRAATAEERVHALLRNTPMRFRVHLMERDCDGQPVDGEIAAAEETADRLAYELLAPVEHVYANFAGCGRRRLAEKLSQFYGLTEHHAERYARILIPDEHVDPLILRLRNHV